MILCSSVKCIQFRRLFSFLPVLLLCACFIEKESSSSSRPSFEEDLAPLLSLNCATAGCHNEDASQGGLNLELTETRLAGDVFEDLDAGNYLNTTTPEMSLLLTQASNSDENDPHTGGEIFSVTSDEYADLLAWITDGALNDDCTNVDHTFETDVLPLFASCSGTGCHDEGANLSLTQENAFMSIQDNGSVNVNDPLGSDLLQYALGNEEHPPGAQYPSVNDEDFRTIFCWIKVDEAQEEPIMTEE